MSWRANQVNVNKRCRSSNLPMSVKFVPQFTFLIHYHILPNLKLNIEFYESKLTKNKECAGHTVYLVNCIRQALSESICC